jgi:hypothetical protein
VVKIWKIPTVESEVFLVLGSFDNSNFLEILILLPLFNDQQISCIDKRSPYKLDEKFVPKKALDDKEMHGQRCIESASTHNEARTIF